MPLQVCCHQAEKLFLKHYQKYGFNLKALKLESKRSVLGNSRPKIIACSVKKHCVKFMFMKKYILVAF